MSERIVKISTPAGEFIGNLQEHPIAERAKKVFVLKQAARFIVSPGPQPDKVNISIIKIDSDGNFRSDLIIGWNAAIIMDMDEKGQIYGLYKNAISNLVLPTGNKIASPGATLSPGPKGIQ